jgi:hypothetical protein
VSLKDLFTSEGRAEAKLKKNLARVVNKNAQSIDRVRAIETLRDIGSDEAILGLLRRFNLKYDKSIEDEQEKDYVYEILCNMGDKVVPMVQKYLAEAESISWGLKVLVAVSSTETLWQVLGELLKKIEPGYERDPTRKVQLLSFLRELAPSSGGGARAAAAALPFLEDIDEGVRFMAVDVAVKHGDESAIRPLAKRIVEDESLRIKKAAADGLIDRGFAVPADAPLVESLASALPDGYSLDKKSGKLRRH